MSEAELGWGSQAVGGGQTESGSSPIFISANRPDQQDKE